MTLHTPLCDLLGVKHPIMLAGMGGVSYADPSLNIDWKIKLTNAIVSEKDLKQPLLKDANIKF